MPLSSKEISHPNPAIKQFSNPKQNTTTKIRRKNKISSTKYRFKSSEDDSSQKKKFIIDPLCTFSAGQLEEVKDLRATIKPPKAKM